MLQNPDLLCEKEKEKEKEREREREIGELHPEKLVITNVSCARTQRGTR